MHGQCEKTMERFISVLLEKFAAALGKQIGNKLAKRIVEKYHQKILVGLSGLFGEKEKKLIRKILLIGSGEIGTEIGLAATNRGWHVRAIGFERDYNGPLDKTPMPIKNLPFYAKGKITDEKNFYYTGEKVDPTKQFQWTVCEEFDIDTIKEIILEEKPDIVLLEDIFLTAEQWKKLQKLVAAELKEEKRILFVPSTEKTEHQEITYADIFLSKIKMKEFIAKIGMKGRLLGKQDQYLEVPSLLKEPRSGDYINEVEKIKKALKEFKGKTIIKFDTISSGHGQFILSDISFLKPSLIQESVSYAKHRASNVFYVLERYLDNKEEVCVIVARTKEANVGLNRIYYKKYDVEKIKDRRFRLVTRLVTAESNLEKDNTLWIALNKIVESISKNLAVPFLYIEFLLDKNQKPKPGIYINEISFRPDDAGFVSYLSHPRDQFSLFIESLECLLDGGKTEHVDKGIEYLAPRDKFRCITINPGKKVEFLPGNMTFPQSGNPLEVNFKLNLYEKHLHEKNGKIDYGRIIGYIWYPVGQDPKKLLSDFKSSLGLDEDTYKTIFDTLGEVE